MACNYLQRGGFFEDSVCGVSKKKLPSYTVSNVCDTWGKYMECEDYKKASSICFITSAVCFSSGKPDDCEELTVMRTFRDEWLMIQPFGKAEIDDYYNNAPVICANINETGNAKEIYEAIYNKYISPCVNFFKSNNALSCYMLYKQMILDLKKQY